MAEEPTQPAAIPADPAIATDATEAQIPADDAPLSEHEAAFGPVDPSLEGEAREQAEATKQKIRHRAKSQQATPADVPRIQKLTKEKHELEERLAALEAKQAQPVAQRPVEQPQPSRQQPAAPQEQPKPEPTRPKPTEEMVGTTYAAYSDFVEDLSEWKFEQRQAAWQQQEQQRRHEAEQADAYQAWQKANESFGTRLAEFKKTHTDYDTWAAQHVHTVLPPVAHKALLLHDQGPALVYHLFQHPELLAEVHFVLDGKPPTDENVAHATRWLSSRMPAGTTGSAAPTPPTIVAARPPNPVRTGPTKTGEELPGDDSSLAEHEHAFGKRHARR